MFPLAVMFVFTVKSPLICNDDDKSFPSTEEKPIPILSLFASFFLENALLFYLSIWLNLVSSVNDTDIFLYENFIRVILFFIKFVIFHKDNQHTNRALAF